jgi:hypothetical protein
MNDSVVTLIKGLEPQNYSKGMLINSQYMGGVSLDPLENHSEVKSYIAFVLELETSEFIEYQKFKNLDEACHFLNHWTQDWVFEATGGCGGDLCGKEGGCSPLGCKKFSERHV